MTLTTEDHAPMTEAHAPRVRCYRCGSADITNLCHHCGKAMCGTHRPEVLDLVKKNPVSKEFADLGLAPEHSGAYHCAEHEHVIKGSLKHLIIAGTVAAVAGVLVAFANLIAGLVIVAAGAGLAAAGYFFGQRRKAAALAARPPLPLIPNLDSVHVIETLSGGVRLSKEGAYTSEPGQIKGAVDVVMTLAKSDRDRPEKYRHKYELASGEHVEFSAGFGVIKGAAGIRLEPEPGQTVTLLDGGMGVAFAGNVDDHPLFGRGDGRPRGEWAVHIPYLLQGAHAPKSVPIWLVPSLVPASDRRTLELDVHWATLEDERRPREERQPLVLEKFELIELVVPTEWGSVENADPPALISNPRPDQTRIIQWKRLETAKLDRSQTLTIRFAKPVELAGKNKNAPEQGSVREQESENELENELRFHLRGSIQASFKGTVSGVEGVAIYRPLGDPWQRPPKPDVKTEPDAKTEVSVDFDLSLSSVRYQEVLVVPDRSQEDTAGKDEKGVERPEIIEFANVVPDYKTVIELTNKMSADNYYVKRVIENPPRGGGRANLLNRYWDIAGRFYDGVYPIDFHVTLTGEEDYGDSVRAHTGSTAARVTVQGMYVQGMYVNDDMKKQIENRWDSLYKLVNDTLGARIHAGAVPSSDQPYQATPWPPPAPRPTASRGPRAGSALPGESHGTAVSRRGHRPTSGPRRHPAEKA